MNATRLTRLAGWWLASLLAGCAADDAPAPGQGVKLGDTAGGGGSAPDDHHQDHDHDHDEHEVPPEEVPEFTGPKLLSGTGLYANLESGDRALGEGVLAYDVRYPSWTDGTDKRRFLWLPPGTVIDTSDMDHWTFPLGTKAWLELSRDGKRLVTRYLVKVAQGRSGWQRVAYVWNDAETDATAEPLGVERVRGTDVNAESATDCAACHRGQRDGLNGVSALQLSGTTGPGSLASLAAAGRLSAAPASAPEAPGEGNVRDALTTLHANCGHCHGPYHPLATTRAMRLQLGSSDGTPEATATYRTAFGAHTSHIIGETTVVIVPGSPEQSQLFVRMGTRNPDEQMPPLGTRLVDERALGVIRTWIESLPK